MKYKIGDHLKSKINTGHKGCWEISAITEKHYYVTSLDENGKPAFSEDSDYGTYRKTIVWTEENMYKI